MLNEELKKLRKLSGILLETQVSVLKNSYLGIPIEEKDVKSYLKDLKDLVGEDDFFLLKGNRDLRDGEGHYHITVLSPMEFSVLKKEGKSFKDFNLEGKPRFLGIGKAQKDSNVAYYIVVDFPEVDEYREKLNLPKKDLHITIGFMDKDVHGVKKDASTLIK